MCNVVQFQFTCQHRLRLRRSRCKGTKHKVTRTSIKAACTAESFLTISLRIQCGPCEHNTWEQDWKAKLERAKTFLNKLTEKRIPGVAEITTLVNELDAHYVRASWDTRNMFAQAPKASVARVGITNYKPARSPLLREVRPEDVVEADRSTSKSWTDMDERDYDGNYVASTDPIHPVSTDYSHPLDDDDGSWVLNHLSPEELEAPHADGAVDFDGCHWSWGDESTVGTRATATDGKSEDTDNSPTPWEATDDLEAGEGLMAWGPEASSPSSSASLNMSGLNNHEKAHNARIEAVIKAFWNVVNNNSTIQHPSSSTDDTLSHLLRSLDIADHTLTPPPASPPSIPSPHPYIWTDGPSDSPPTTPPPPPARPSTPPSPNSTRAWYDKQRRYLKKRKETDVRKYYSDWLLVSRYEVRAFEGPEGRCIPDPPVLWGVGCGG